MYPYLLPQADGLAMRESNEYAKDKLRILEAYIDRFETSMRKKHWRARYFVDLQAGPGKNRFPDGNVMLGSPLIALTTEHPFTHYRFVELDSENCDALEMRVSTSDLRDRVKIMRGDCNVWVDEIVQEIRALDKQWIEGQWSSLNLAFLDPEGMELRWETVEKLGRMNRMDLIITFPTGGIIRTARVMLKRGEGTLLDDFFGTREWREVYAEVEHKHVTQRRRVIIDYYKSRLAPLGYNVVVDPDIVAERIFANKRRTQVYSLIFASKDKLGDEFWQDVLRQIDQPRLL